MKEIILITGANGHLAKTVKKLLSKKYTIRSLTTNKKSVDGTSTFYWDINKNIIDKEALSGCKHIIHLCGYSILKRWTKKNRNLMYSSRVGGANLLFNKCQELKIFPVTFISASASGIYGLESNGEKNEKDNVGSDWVAKMASDWEDSAQKFKEINSRVVNMRISLLLSEKYGFLKYTLLSMKFGLGVIFGEKNDPINWIHVNDAANFIQESIKNDTYKGPYNLASHKEMSKYEFIKIVKKNRYPYALIVRIPTYLVRLFFGKRSLILDNKVSLCVEKLKKIKFKFEINKLEDLFSKKPNL